MLIEYERTNVLGYSETDQDSIQWWIEFNLESGGIESQVEKLRKLLSIVGEQFLIDNPDRVGNVASAIGCKGYRHKITHSES